MDDLLLIPVDRDARLATKAYDQVRMALMRGRLAPGQRLVHRALATDLGVSPTPVREALLRLASEGALDLDRRGIACVPMLDHARLAEIMSLRVILESRAAMATARHSTDADVSELEEVHASLVNAKRLGDVDAALAANEQFHFKVIALAGMPVLHRLLESLWMQCGPTIRLLYTVPPASPVELHPHVDLLEAFRQRSPKLARSAITRDLDENGSILLRLVKQATNEK